MWKISSLRSYFDKQKFKNHAELGQTLTLPFGEVCCPSFTCTNFKFLAYNLNTFLNKTCGFDFISGDLIPNSGALNIRRTWSHSRGGHRGALGAAGCTKGAEPTCAALALVSIELTKHHSGQCHCSAKELTTADKTGFI